MGIFVLGLTVMLTNLTGLNDRARDLVQANGFAENQVEALRSANYVALTDGTVDISDELPNSLGLPRSAQYTISTLQTGLKQVEVYIEYTVFDTVERLTYTSNIGELGVAQ